MAGTFSSTLLPPQEIPIGRIGLVALFALILNACGTIDYDIHSENFFSAASHNKEMATIHFHYGDGSDDYAMHVRSTHGGIALQSSMYENTNGDSVHFITSGTMERKYYMGIEGRFSF